MGQKIERVLVAIDFSDTTTSLLQFISTLHNTFAPQFILLHVFTPQVLGHLKKTSFSEKKQALEFAQKELAPLWEKLEGQLDGISFQKEFREGVPHIEIGACAEELQCDLILLGFHLRSRFQEIFVGNTATNILNSTDIPILLFKAPQKEKSKR